MRTSSERGFAPFPSARRTIPVSSRDTQYPWSAEGLQTDGRAGPVVPAGADLRLLGEGKDAGGPAPHPLDDLPGNAVLKAVEGGDLVPRKQEHFGLVQVHGLVGIGDLNVARHTIPPNKMVFPKTGRPFVPAGEGRGAAGGPAGTLEV